MPAYVILCVGITGVRTGRQVERKMGYLGKCLVAPLAIIAMACGSPAHAQKTLRAVMHSDLKILDPLELLRQLVVEPE